MLRGGSTGDAGEWKQRNNEIIEISPSGERRVRFVPATPEETPEFVGQLCANLRDALEDGCVPPLLLAAAFVLDLLCIHPFRDGNGRVSRLATTLLLLSDGFQVGRYVSLERLVEESKEAYYQVLERSSRGWKDGRNEILPWWNYLLGIVRSGYREFETQVGLMSGRPAKADLVRRTVLEQAGEFSLAGLVGQLPGVSAQLIKKVLGELKAEGLVHLRGRGKGATWRVVQLLSG